SPRSGRRRDRPRRGGGRSPHARRTESRRHRTRKRWAWAPPVVKVWERMRPASYSHRHTTRRARMAAWSKTWTYFQGDWHEGNVPIMGIRTHAAWLCSSVFDGARAFEGVTPDLDLHCARVNASARTLQLKPLVSTETWLGLVEEGMKRFDRNAALYIRPMYWAEQGGPLLVAPDPE